VTYKTTFAKAINDGISIAMEKDPNVICYGLGADDPLGVFGTTLGLQERFGEQRVFDMPTSENAMTGVAIGAALNGIRSVVTHQRLDFFLLAMDQLVNNAAKWHYMFGGNNSVPITIRLILGRGWGQGPTHSQNLQAWFAHVPGLKVVMPTTAEDAKGLLLSSIFDDNPVVFLEHRWLHNQEAEIPEGDVRIPLGKAKLRHTGKDLSIVSMSYMTVEALHAVEYLEEQGISCDVVDLRTVSPLDWEAVFNSVKKTGRLLALDTGVATGSVAGEIVSRVSMELFGELKQAPQRLALPDFPTPTSHALTKTFYVRSEDIVLKVGEMMGKELHTEALSEQRKAPSHDVPGEWFKGPF
jgi:acetoin:2,6-dichlorophenolindophenol oxidoreductase subunit beta